MQRTCYFLELTMNRSCNNSPHYTVHTLQKTEIIRLRSNMWQQVRNHLSTFASRLELPLWTSQISVGALERNKSFVPRERFAVQPDKFRLKIECVDLADRAGTKDNNDVLCPRRKMWTFVAGANAVFLQ